jgi:hypothetical protein
MPEIKDIRRQIADPDNEPDFYEISQRFPVSSPSKTSNKVAVAAASANVLPVATFFPVKTAVMEEPPLKRPRLLVDTSTVSPSRMILPHRPSAVSMALAMSQPRPQILPQEARLQMLRLLREQEKRRELILTSLLLRRHHESQMR